MPKKTKNSLDIEKNSSAAAASYIWIVSLYILLTRPKSDFAQFHARQGAALFAVEILAGLVGPFALIIIIVAIVLSVKGFLAASRGEHWVMPFLGRWLQEQHS